MGEWKTYRLGDIIEIVSGFAYKGEYLGKGDKYLLGMGCVSFNEQFLEKGLRPYSGNCDKRYYAKDGDIVLATRQQSDNMPILGMPAIIPKKYKGKQMIVGANLYRVINKSKDFSNDFIYWLLKSPDYVNYIKSCQTGTTVRMITKANIENYTFICPSRESRLLISHFLWTLENKIELNRRINANLEAQAQALFRSWFVDFEPFRDGPFVDSQLGKIPNDFQIIKTGEIPMIITDFVANGSFASLKDNVTILQEKDYAYFIRNVDLKDKKFETYVNKHAYEFLSKSALFGNEIIISNVGDVGSVFLCPKLDRPMTLGNNIIMLRPKESQMLYYLYIWFKWFQGQSLIQGIKSGSAQPKFNKTDFKNLPIILPPRTTLRAFHSIIEPFFNKINFLTHENQILSALRDTLLPKLIAGEIAIE